MNRLTLIDIEGFLIKKVTRFGNGAKVDCPKQYLGKTVYLVIADDKSGTNAKKNGSSRKRKQ
ncbi:MAG: DUF2080 family transposase-associated protein [Bacteroidetes bacterium]|nr:MAG: DUF2080 family transposase-associated protein [Bacteroidota bacterium]